MSNLSTRLSTDISKSAKAATNYKEWLESNTHLAGSRAEEIRQDCVRLEDELGRLSTAADRRMCVGVFGQSQAGKSYLVSSLASRPGQSLMIKAGKSELSFIGDVNPMESNKESTGIVTRFTTSGSTQNSEFPIELKLLSEMDVAKILSDTYFQDLNEESRKPLLDTDIEAVLDSVASDVLTRQSDSAFELKRYLQRHIGDISYQAYFGHYESYWSKISSVFQFGTLAERISVFSLFWGNNSYLTELFNKMVSALEDLGHPVRCWAPTSIFAAEANCIVVSTQEAILDGVGIVAELRTESGQKASIDHSIISALTAEMVAVITDPPSSFYSHADLLDFPGARTRERLDAITTGNLGKLLTRGKVAYLFNRYLDARELTAMLLCVKDSTQEVATLSKMVDDWLDVTHGMQAEARSEADCALFFVLTMADKHFSATDAKMLLEDRMESSFEKFVGSGDHAKTSDEGQVSWLNDWSKGKPFNNSFWLRNTSMVANGILFKGEAKRPDFKETGLDPAYLKKFEALLDAARTSKKVSRYFKDSGKAWKEMTKINDGGRSYLLGSIEKVCHPEFKLRQIKREYEKFKAQLIHLTSEFFADGDAEKIFKERVGQADRVISDIRICARERKFGEFLAVCHVKENTITDLLRKIEREVEFEDDVAISNFNTEHDDPFADLISDTDSSVISEGETSNKEVVEKHLYFANSLMRAWQEQLEKRTTNKQVRDYFHLTEESLAIIKDEFIEGAERINLPAKIAETSREASRFPRFAEKLFPHKSRLAAQMLNNFVNQLGYESGEITMPNRNKTPVFSRPKIPEDVVPDLPRDPESRELVSAAHWAFAFRNMTAQNAENNTGLEGIDLEANARLGEIIEALEIVND